MIDHGAALFFHHQWDLRDAAASKAYPTAADHVLLPVASSLTAAHERLAPLVTRALLDNVLSRVPDEWLNPEAGLSTPDDVRSAYAEVLLTRVSEPGPWLDAVEVTRAASL